MSKYYKAEDVISFLNMNCPKDMWEYQIADLPTIEVSEDAISREWMLEQLSKAEEEKGGTFETDSEKVRTVIEHAPSVIPQTKEGEWKFKKIFPNDDSEFPMGYLVCSVCGSQHANATPCNYCDNCGAKMKGEKNSGYERS